MLTCPEKPHVDCDMLICPEKLQVFYFNTLLDITTFWRNVTVRVLKFNL